MSVRIHVVGAYGATEDELRAALNTIGEEGNGSQAFRIGCNGGWSWAHASVWHVNGSAIDDALSSLSVPAFRVTSCDAILWTLTLTGPGKDRFHGVHHFTMVGSEPGEDTQEELEQDEDFPADELEEVAGINRFVPELQFLWDAEEEARLSREYAEEVEQTVEGLDDYTDYGVALPATLVEEMKRHPNQADYLAFMAHGTQIVEALHAFGFDVDQEAMLTLLTVGPLTEIEQDADVGNMPRFLQTLGIEGVFREEAEPAAEPGDNEEVLSEPDNDVAQWSEHPPGELLEKMDVLMSQCPLSEISEGPVRLTHVALLHLLAHQFSEDPTTSVLLQFPDEGEEPNSSWQNLDELEVRQHGKDWQFSFGTQHWWYGAAEREELETNSLSEALGTPVDGTRIEISFAVEGLAEQCHRYAGTYRNQILEVEQAHPPIAAVVLRDALALVEQTLGSQAIDLLSEDEESAIRFTYQRSTGNVPKIRNRRIKPEYGSRDVVVQTLLFERFNLRGPWDIAGARKRIEADWELFEQVVNPKDEEAEEEPLPEEATDENPFLSNLQQMAEAMQEANTVPHSEEVIYKGKTGQFFRASMADLEHVSQESMEEFDKTLASLGLEPIGDSVGDVDQRQEITRCYSGHPQAIALLSHRKADNQYGWADVANGAVLVDFSNGTQEFHTHFQDGTSLVTTSIEAVSSKPDVDIYVRSYEDFSTHELWEKHLDGIRRFKEHRATDPIDHTAFMEPARFMKMMDEFFSRFLSGS